MIYKIFIIIFCLLVAGALIWIICDSFGKTKVNGKK